MNELNLTFDEINYIFPLVFVHGTGENHFPFGLENDLLRIRIKDFFISKYPVTQVLWKYIMGKNPACSVGENKPIENVSYNDIVEEDGFFQKLNSNS
jgi:formylglycine-generating enzyme required for sulfatase activity